MGKKILLIGGTGTISTDVMKLTKEKGYSVHVLNRGNRKSSILPGVIFLKADIHNRNEVINIIKDHTFDIVIDFLSYNLSDLENSFSLFKNKCKQFIFISTACVYKRNKENEIITEQSPLGNPEWDYSLNKVACEKYIKIQCENNKVKYTIVRPYITYGDTRIPYGIMPAYKWHWTLIARIENNKPILLWDKGNAVCTLTHTSDFAKGIVGLLGNPNALNEAFHIVSDDRYKWKDVAKLIGKYTNQEIQFLEIPSEFIAANFPSIKGVLLGDRSLDAVFDNSKIKKIVPEFECTTSLEKGISQTIEYYKKNNFLNGIDYKWDAQIDRLMYKYLKKEAPEKINSYNLKFKNYLNDSISAKLTYLKYRYLPNGIIALLYLFKRIITKIKTSINQ